MSALVAERVLVIIKIAIFWLLFLLPGLALSLVLNEKFKKQEENVLLSLPKYFLLTLAYLVPMVLLSYAFSLPFSWLFAWFLLGLAASLLFLSFKRRVVTKYLSFTFKEGTRERSLWLLFGFLAIDVLISARLGGFLYGDALVHMGKVLKISAEGFSFSDPFIKGGIESRYHVNIVYPLYGLPAKLLSLPVITVWRDSFWFFHSLIILSFFGFAQKFLKNFFGAALAAVGAMALFYGVFAYASVPNTMIFIFIALALTALYGYLGDGGKKDLVLYYLSVCLMAMVHPIYALAMALFVGFYLVMSSLLNKRIEAGKFKTLAPSILILLSSPVYSFAFPNYMTELSRDYGLGGGIILELNKYLFSKNFLHDYIKPFLMINAVFLFYFWSRAKETYKKNQIIFVSALILFPAVTVFNPLVYPILNKFMPYWVINRFSSINLFHFFSLPLLAYLLISEIKSKYLKIASFGLVLAFFSGHFYYIELPKAVTIGKISADYERRGQALLKTIEKVPEGATVGSVYLEDNFIMPSFKNVYVLTVPEGNASPAVDITKRNELFKSLEHYDKESLPLLIASDIEYLLVGADKKEILTDKENFSVIDSQKGYYLVKINNKENK